MNLTVPIHAAALNSGPPTPPEAPGARTDGAFGQVLARQHQTVLKGDTLTGMVKAQARAQGVQLDDATAYRTALQVARDNRLEDANRILPGQRMDMDTATALIQRRQGLDTPLATSAGARSPRAMDVYGQTLSATSHASQDSLTPAERTRTPVLDRTLHRAVALGYLSANEQPGARERVLAMAQKYNFHPDDFAVVSLMESDGLNPQASNGSCHGVIQFCEGPNRGAASVGLQGGAQALLRMRVTEQLALTDRYFADVGLNDGKPKGLDDLYLAVLTPAARAEWRPDVPLAVPGRQARALHVDQNQQLPITRRSLVEGLVSHAATLLGLTPEALIAERRSGEATLAQSDAPEASRVPTHTMR